MLRYNAGKPVVHSAFRITDRHTAGGIAVVTAFNGQHFVFFRPVAGNPGLHGHLDGDLHRHRTGVGEKDAVHGFWRHSEQLSGQFDGWLMSQATKHDMGKLLNLLLQRGVHLRMVVAMHHTPPGRHAINQPTAIIKVQINPLRPHHREHSRRVVSQKAGPAVWVPDMFGIKGQIFRGDKRAQAGLLR